MDVIVFKILKSSVINIVLAVQGTISIIKNIFDFLHHGKFLFRNSFLILRTSYKFKNFNFEGKFD